MTIEGRPNIQADEYWKKEFQKQRRDRLQDSIDEYLQDEEIDPRQAYEEILLCVQDVVSYHKNNLKRAEDLQHLLLGYRHIDLDLPERY